jgi:hypothetical protein
MTRAVGFEVRGTVLSYFGVPLVDLEQVPGLYPSLRDELLAYLLPVEGHPDLKEWAHSMTEAQFNEGYAVGMSDALREVNALLQAYDQDEFPRKFKELRSKADG